MTKNEAIEAMIRGDKLTHRFFQAHEWVTIVANKLIEHEDGTLIWASIFWKDRLGKEWETDWSIWQEPAAPTTEDSKQGDVEGIGEMKWQQWGETITISNFEGDTLKINPNGNYDAGIPSKEDRALAELTVAAINNYPTLLKENGELKEQVKILRSSLQKFVTDEEVNGWGYNPLHIQEAKKALNQTK